MGQCQKCIPCESLINDSINYQQQGNAQQIEPIIETDLFSQQLEQQESNTVKEAEQTIIDFSLEAHSPNLDQARPLSFKEQQSFMIPREILGLFKSQGPLYIKDHIDPQLKQLPALKTPYFIESLDALYVGQWKFGQPWAQGILYYTNGNVYEGFQRNGIPQGYGRKFQSDGTYLIGYFEKGHVSGKGTFVKPNGFKYEGQWVNDLPEGNGKEIWPNGTTYMGQYKSGSKNGYGRFTWMVNKGRQIETCSESYEGNFENDVFEGQGQYEWLDGRNYSGNWRAGKMDGKGEFKWIDGRKYEGSYFQDLKHGLGTFTWPNGKKWEGSWTLGKMDGIGAVTMMNGKTYVGMWKDGKRLCWIKEFNNYNESKSVVSNFSQNFTLRDYEEKLQDQISESTSLIPNKQISQTK